MAVIRLKFVNGFRNKQRENTRVRYFFRRRGSRAIPLPGLPGSEEFMTAYATALASVPTANTEIGASRTLPGTINALVVAYYKSVAWQELADDSRDTRRSVIERFREQHGDKRVALLRDDHILNMLAKIERLTVKKQWLVAIRHLL